MCHLGDAPHVACQRQKHLTIFPIDARLMRVEGIVGMVRCSRSTVRTKPLYLNCVQHIINRVFSQPQNITYSTIHYFLTSIKNYTCSMDNPKSCIAIIQGHTSPHVVAEYLKILICTPHHP